MFAKPASRVGAVAKLLRRKTGLTALQRRDVVEDEHAAAMS
jgi:hypothetical protein